MSLCRHRLGSSCFRIGGWVWLVSVALGVNSVVVARLLLFGLIFDFLLFVTIVRCWLVIVLLFWVFAGL